MLSRHHFPDAHVSGAQRGESTLRMRTKLGTELSPFAAFSHVFFLQVVPHVGFAVVDVLQMLQVFQLLATGLRACNYKRNIVNLTPTVEFVFYVEATSECWTAAKAKQ